MHRFAWLGLLWAFAAHGAPADDTIDVVQVMEDHLRAPTKETEHLLGQLAQWYEGNCATAHQTGPPEAGIPFCDMHVRVLLVLVGSAHDQVGAAYVNLGGLFDRAGQAAEAADAYGRGLLVLLKTRDANDPAIGRAMSRLGHQFLALAPSAERRRDAEMMFRRALAIAEAPEGTPPDPLVIETRLADLATLLHAMGRSAEALPLLRRRLALAKTNHLPTSPEMLAPWNELAIVHTALGDFGKAEPLYRKALTLAEAVRGPDDAAVGTVLNNLGSLLRDTGRNREAEILIRRAVEIAERTYGSSHIEVAPPSNNLAGLLRATGRDEAAVERYRTVLAIVERDHGADHPMVGRTLGNLGLALRTAGHLDEAERVLRRAVDIAERTLGPDHPTVANGLTNLAYLLVEQHRVEPAQALYRRALAISEQVFGPGHPAVARTLNNLSWLSVRQGRIDEALAWSRQALDAEEADLALNLLVGTPRQRRLRLRQFQTSTDRALSLHLQRAATSREAARLALQTWLRRKGRLEALERVVTEHVRDTASEDDQARFRRLTDVTEQLARASAGGPTDELADLWAVQRELQQQLAASSATVRKVTRGVDLDDVVDALPDGAGLLEFAVYHPVVFEDDRLEPPRYAAYVLTADGRIHAIDLGTADAIDAMVVEVRHALLDRQPARVAALDLVEATLGRLDLPPDVRHLFIASDGALNLIPLGSLAVLAGAPGAFPSMSHLSSGRELLDFVEVNDAHEPPVVVFDVDYGPTGRWRPLAGAQEEGRRLLKTLRKARALTGSEATEQALRRLRGPQVLHVASHGFFRSDEASSSHSGAARGVKHLLDPETATPALVASELPMLRSGIVLAGANRASASDGLVTAAELATIDLRGTHLVTLSACHTAEGEVRTGDGVYGLRRALVLAGSHAQVLSLWAVDDEATAFLMSEMYRSLRRGATVQAALDQARHEVRSRPKWSSPYYWAAFTLSGNPAVTL